MGLAYIPFIAVMEDDKGPVVNLYNAANIEMKTPKGLKLDLQIITQYPLSEKVVIKVNPTHSEKFVVKLRNPIWSENTTISVNGQPLDGAKAGSYFDIEREWNPDDCIELNFEMKCQLIDAPKGSNRGGDNFQAVIYGPIVLARDESVDSDYDQPVQVIADEAGTVKIVRVKPVLEGTRMEWLVPTANGDIRMSDYSSVNAWDGSRICTWLPSR